MADTIQKEAVFSGEQNQTATVESPPEAAKTAEHSETEKAWQSSKQPPPLLETVRSHGYPSLAECAKFLKRTRRVWLIAAGAVFGLTAVVSLVEPFSERARNARERRQEQAVDSVTPDRLVARCGQPTEDMTKDMYPVLVRTLSYQPRGNKKLVLVFSRTAEEKSDWVFLAIKDESGARSYDTPEAKIAALPCLDSKK